ncbi:MAG TPA: hypothetical protein VGP77_12755 [Vicinamibacterales bacterium]|nr:hypothetical protein [Vicinamibacterales bacterium]
MTTTLLSGGMSRSTGSLSIGAPFGIETLPWPANVSVRSVPLAMLDAVLCNATCAAPIVKASVPNSLVSRTRSV